MCHVIDLDYAEYMLTKLPMNSQRSEPKMGTTVQGIFGIIKERGSSEQLSKAIQIGLYCCKRELSDQIPPPSMLTKLISNTNKGSENQNY